MCFMAFGIADSRQIPRLRREVRGLQDAGVRSG